MHNNIMVVGSKDHPPMLATGRYAQWQSCQPTTDESPAVEEQSVLETFSNITPKNKAHYDAEKEAIHLILTGIGNDIYSTVDACKTTHDMWIAIARLQQEVNEIRAEKIARNANPLALVDAAQQYPNTYYQAPKPHKSYANPSKQSSSTRFHVATSQKDKAIAKPITPPSESASKEDSNPEQAQRDKDMHNNLALIAKYFKKIYKPTNNNLKTSSNTRNNNVDTSPRYNNDNQTGQFGNKRTVTVAKARETEYRKPKRVKGYTYHKEQLLLCKQAEKGVPLQVEQADWLENMDEEVDE
ncbi:hypothetical protein Tco_0980767 [Tanacetum coccineum]